ncbi:MAG: hypothetical protein PHI86_01095 [Candidatus Omnitrophica bacterium]|nr:hypothetical protein [Candidatus Omnitrophota bacterium]HOX54587.1 hypothetical protein [Candidatus Omnitrophota bacterium]
MRSFAVILSLFFLAAVMFSGCGKKEGDEPTKYVSQAGLEQLTKQAQKTGATTAGITSNPKFSSAKGITPANTTAKDIDGIIRPVLAKFFGDARLVSAKGPEAPQRDGEVVEDRMIYSVKRIIKEGDGDSLHSAFRSAGFSTSPRLGSKPTHSRGNVYMSLFESTSQRSYSFVITVDTGKQQIEVQSYRLGSKYDRLM